MATIRGCGMPGSAYLGGSSTSPWWRDKVSSPCVNIYEKLAFVES